ncbi:uncharacterized protein MONBRDRAFT_30617, partial [Monosiga brevicollis MX1]
MDDPNADTQWNDILREKGILPPKEPEITEDDLIAMAEEAAAKVPTAKDGRAMESLNLEELDELEDDEDDAFLEEYRRKRMAELHANAHSHFGSLINISGKLLSRCTLDKSQEYTKEVNQAGKGVWVIVYLYKPDLLVCRRLQQILGQLAEKFPTVKFVQSISTNCIPNYPDRNLPSIFVYLEDDMKKQFVGPSIFGGESMTLENVEWSLAQIGALKSDIEEDPRASSVQQTIRTTTAINPTSVVCLHKREKLAPTRHPYAPNRSEILCHQ